MKRLGSRTLAVTNVVKAEMAAKSQKKFGNAEWEQFSDPSRIEF